MNLLLKISPVVKYKKCYILVYVNATGPSCFLFSAILKKGEVELDLMIEDSSDFNLLNDKKLNLKGQPVILSLFGEGVVQRTYRGTVSQLNTIIPNINVDDYHIDSCTYGDDNTFLALFRMGLLEKIIADINKQNVLIGKISLGFVDVVQYKNALLTGKDELFIGGQYVKITDGLCETGKKVKTGNEESPASEFLKDIEKAAYGNAISFFLNSKGLPGTLSPILLSNLKELIAAKISALLIKYLLPALMTLLLLNFVLFDRFQKKIDQLSGSLSNTENLRKQVEQLKTQIESEKEFYAQTNLHKNKQFALYVDRVSSLSVQGIRFEKLSVNPLQKRIRGNEMIMYKKNEIELKGTADNAECFSEFLMNINSSALNLRIGKQAYFYDKNKGKADFELVLEFPDE